MAKPLALWWAMGWQRFIRLLCTVAALASCVGIWHVLAHFRVQFAGLTFVNVPAPLEVFAAAIELLGSPRLLLHLTSSLYRVGWGFLVASLLGIGLGVLIGRYWWCQRLLLPPLEVLRPIPAVAWIPLAILMFSSSEVSMIFITFVGAFFPILLNTIHGVEAVDPRLIASARSLGSRPLAVCVR